MTLPLPAVVAQLAQAHPDRSFFQMVDEAVWTYGAMHRHGLDWAAALAGLGVAPQTRVATLIPNSADAVGLWLGLGWLRAIEAPINLDYQGELLEKTLAYIEPSLVIVHERFRAAVTDAVGRLAQPPAVLFLSSGETPLRQRLRSLDDTPPAAPVQAPLLLEPRLHDLTLMLFTSGTSGSPKGVLVPWGQLCAGPPMHVIDEPLAAYAAAPMFHTAGRGVLAHVVRSAGRIVCRERFSGSQFWSDVERHGCNLASMMASALAYLAQQGLPPGFAGTPLTYVTTGRVPEAFADMMRPFGLKYGTLFNMTEISPPIASVRWSSAPDRSCGRLRTGYECRIVDDFDREVAPGEEGELVLRAAEPFTLMQGYWRRPEDTTRAWRNLWFHTGDLFVCNEAGDYHYIDRKEDRIRRRGENISPEAIETAVLRHPAVLECAVVGVASKVWDSDIKAVVVLREGMTLDPEALRAFIGLSLPVFMLPRYVVFAHHIPRTATGKAKRALLRDLSVDERVWDADASPLVQAVG